jgi:hypothetical protein
MMTNQKVLVAAVSPSQPGQALPQLLAGAWSRIAEHDLAGQHGEDMPPAAGKCLCGRKASPPCRTRSGQEVILSTV